MTTESINGCHFRGFSDRFVQPSHLEGFPFDFSHIARPDLRLYWIQRFEDSTESSVKLGATTMKRNLILLVIIGWMALTLIYRAAAAL